MGQVASRMHATFIGGTTGPRTGMDGTEEGETNEAPIYSRCASDGIPYFGSHFMMGGERRELAKDSSLFFLDNKELDLLGDKPVEFPYATGKPSDTVIPLGLVVNIRKESIKFVRMPKEEGDESEGDNYNITFMFDTDGPGFVRLHFDAVEMMDAKHVTFVHNDAPHSTSTEMHEFSIGADLIFNEFAFNTSQIDPALLQNKSDNLFPVVIELTALGLEGNFIQTQTTTCSISVASDKSRSLILKPKRQRVAIDGVQYLLQEIFGLENIEQREREEDIYKCVVCMDDIRDTIILPCRHLCICNGCADTLKLHDNNCPICREPFRALVQMKAKRAVGNSHTGRTAYEQLMLVEALNGPINILESSDGEEEKKEDGRGSTRRSTLSRRMKSRKSPTNDITETEEGIELKNAEFFRHHPANVVLVKPATTSKKRRSEVFSSDSEDEQRTSANKEEDPSQITPDPASFESQESTNALLH